MVDCWLHGPSPGCCRSRSADETFGSWSKLFKRLSNLLQQHLSSSCRLFYTRAIDCPSRARQQRARPCVSVRVKTRALGQSGRRIPPAPIRTPERSSRQGGQMRILFTQPRGTHLTRTLSRNIVQKAVFFLIHFPLSLIRLWPSWGGCP